MYQLRYEIETLSPVILTQISGDMNMVSTLDYIPGTVVQGIFAKRYIKEIKPQSEAHEDPVFYEWFLNSGIVFTNAYIADEEVDGQKTYFFPISFSIHECKIARNEIEKKTALDLMLKKFDNIQTRNINGYFRIEKKKIFTKNVKKSINFHHARENRLRGHSKEGIIFNYESLNAGQIFAGNILGSEADLKQIKTLIESQEKIRIGRSKNTQYGETRLLWISEEPEEYKSEMQGFVPDELKNDFILTFLSNTIIYNECGFASASTSDLRRYLAESLNFDAPFLAAEKIEITKSFKRTEIVENFVGKWLLKKPSENSIKAGSCFQVTLNVTSEQFDNNIKESLLKLQKTGIGERTGEGFGRFFINLQKLDQYELNKSDEEEIKDNPKGTIKRPDEEIPKLAKGIVKSVILDSYYTRIEARALEDCSDFSKEKGRIPSNSLIGKIELMLRDSESSEIFIKKIEAFPQLTKNKLERCRSEVKKKTLYSFLVPNKNNPRGEKAVSEDKDVYKLKESEIFTQIDDDTDLKAVCELISFDPKEDPCSKFKLYSRYWLTFLAKMRKEKKKIPVMREGGEN